jgi:AcrR family transcriptional regulator
MARPQDEGKRNQILLAAKHLFARQGFHNTSISDLTRETGLPVGTIYTYFAGKDDIMVSIIESGWQDLAARLQAAFAQAGSLEERIAVLSEYFFGELVKDSELIHILLTEAVELTRINEKLDVLMGLVVSLQQEARQRAAMAPPEPPTAADRAAVVVFFMGMLHAVRLSPGAQLGFSTGDIQDFMRRMVHQSLLFPPASDNHSRQ